MFHFHSSQRSNHLRRVIALSVVVIVLAVAAAIIFAWKKKSVYIEAVNKDHGEDDIDILAALMEEEAGNVSEKEIRTSDESMKAELSGISDDGFDRVADAAYKAYDAILEEYKLACVIGTEEWFNNLTEYRNQFPDVNQYVLDEYHIPSHDFGDEIGDEPYVITYAYYDIDNNQIPELVMGAMRLIQFRFFPLTVRKL